MGYTQALKIDLGRMQNENRKSIWHSLWINCWQKFKYAVLFGYKESLSGFYIEQQRKQTKNEENYNNNNKSN